MTQLLIRGDVAEEHRNCCVCVRCEDGEPVNKTVFIIFFQGDQLKTKVKKICEGLV
ncbi:unnamed protein product [Nippostrongylus brasiliensis]|uniref:V-type proton ATPase subunit a n=1 Tax=Nippostrongylus brasiliensis TaxID=27835 RepID=A0A0N4XMQ5_NIPBR|nr:unnamed protein product [Nippostrongylus brasiliensis]